VKRNSGKASKNMSKNTFLARRLLFKRLGTQSLRVSRAQGGIKERKEKMGTPSPFPIVEISFFIYLPPPPFAVRRSIVLPIGRDS